MVLPQIGAANRHIWAASVSAKFGKIGEEHAAYGPRQWRDQFMANLDGAADQVFMVLIRRWRDQAESEMATRGSAILRNQRPYI